MQTSIKTLQLRCLYAGSCWRQFDTDEQRHSRTEHVPEAADSTRLTHDSDRMYHSAANLLSLVSLNVN